MLELIVYPKPTDPKLINNSPFCSKTEVFLKMAQLEYKVHNFTGNPGKFPKGKLPVIKHKGQMVADSALIQNYLTKEFNIDIDSHLSPQNKAQGYAFSKMLEEFLYWSLLHERWFIDENWENLKNGYFNNIPKLVRGFVTSMIRKQTKKSAIGHGMSRHSDSDIHKMGQESIEALAEFLGDKTYLLGDQISTYDSTSYAFVSSLLHSPLGPKLKSETLKHQNLVDYDNRMFQLFS